MSEILDDPEQLVQFFIDLESTLAGADFTGDLRKELQQLNQVHSEHFLGQTDPLHNPWATLAESTIAAKGIRSGHQAEHSTILVDTGRLFESLAMGDTPDGDRIRTVERLDTGAFLTFGTSVPYSIFHDTGTGRMPARVHVGMNPDDVDKMVNRLADAAVEKLKE